MTAATRRRRTLIVRTGWLTVSHILGALVVGVALGAGVNAATVFLAGWIRIAAAAVVAVAVFTAGAALWGRALARVAKFPNERRVGRMTAVIVGPAVIVVALTLSTLEPTLVARGALAGLPIHVVYRLVFVPAALVIGALGGLALGLRTGQITLAARLAVWTGVSSAAAFLIVDLLLDAAGWRVGAPDAGRRATMLVVTGLGALAAAWSAGLTIGFVLTELNQSDSR